MNTITTNTNLQKHFLVTFVEIIVCHLIAFYKRMLKYFLRFVTRQTELERICHNEKIESVRIKKIGKFTFLRLIINNNNNILVYF